MAKDLSVSFLLDFYGNLLTDKQRDVIDLYYNEDLSLAEIAQLSGITRQGVRDSIVHGEAVLREMEEKLGLFSRYNQLKSDMADIAQQADKIERINQKLSMSYEIEQSVKTIIAISEKVVKDSPGE